MYHTRLQVGKAPPRPEREMDGRNMNSRAYWKEKKIVRGSIYIIVILSDLLEGFNNKDREGNIGEKGSIQEQLNSPKQSIITYLPFKEAVSLKERQSTPSFCWSSAKSNQHLAPGAHTPHTPHTALSTSAQEVGCLPPWGLAGQCANELHANSMQA